MRRQVVLLGGLFLLLLVALVVVPPSNQRQMPLTVYSAEPGGGKALRLWLEALGHPVVTLEGERYAIGQDVEVLLLLAPSEFVEGEASGELERWTRQGGRLIVATNGLTTRQLLRRFEVGTDVGAAITRVVPAGPGLLDPAIAALNVERRITLDLDDATGAVPLLLGEVSGETPPPTPSPRRGGGRGRGSEGGGPVVAARVPAGRGELIVLTDPALLSNEALRTEANARLALALIGPDRRARIAFDEVHHGFGLLQRRSFFSLLLAQSWGRVSFLAGVVVLLFLLWRGRRFGRAIPVFVDRGRSLGELVTSQAGLYRAGGKRPFIAAHLARQLRQEIARTVGLPADAPDAEIAARATAIGRDPAPALSALAKIGQARSDADLLAITREGERARAALAQAPATSRKAPARMPGRDDARA
jgi:hypothetical protein